MVRMWAVSQGDIRARNDFSLIILASRGSLEDPLTTSERRAGTTRLAAGRKHDCVGAVGGFLKAV